MKTYSAKPSDVTRSWYVIDAADQPLGRVSTVVARLLIGKNKPQVTAHIDCGDYVVIVNAKNLLVTGDKLTVKKYYRHSGYAGALKKRTLQEQLEADPTQVIIAAVRGMLPVNKLRDGRLARLKVYAEKDHGHSAQNPQVISLKDTK